MARCWFSHAMWGMRSALWIVLAAGPVAGAEGPLEKEAARLHQQVLTVDSHVDTPLRIVRGKLDIGVRHEVSNRGGRVDLPRMKEGGLDAIFFAVYMSQGPRTQDGHEAAKQNALRIFRAIHDALDGNRDQAELALTPDDAYRLERAGKRAVFIGMENGYPIGRDLSLVQKYYDLGARYITLCHVRNNELCDSSTDDKVEHHGLSDLGREVVREMNRLGMMIDVSHASDETFYDVIRESRAPVIASHSCARALCDHPRNLDDAMLKALADHGGVIQICLYRGYVKKRVPNPQREAALKQLDEQYGEFERLSDQKKDEYDLKWEEIDRQYPESDATLSDVVDHIDHVVQVAGIDHVGIGSDFDGGAGLDGCQDVSEMGNITLELRRRGYRPNQIRKIWGENFMRVFREVARVARTPAPTR